jgi:dTDP-4-amino-4,6-dideoxygalactose transaminase
MIHIIYRYVQGDNHKPRPPYYSKAVCLESLLNASRLVQASTGTLLSDGPIDSIARELIGSAWSIREVPKAGLHESFLLALEVAAALPADEWVYLVEDDYLHVADALRKLSEVAEISGADYVTLFDDPLRYRLTVDVMPDLPVHEAKLIPTATHHWRTIESTTFTFATKAGTIRDDMNVFKENVAHQLAHPSHVMDREAWRELQGLGSHKKRGTRRTLLGAIPALSTHMEVTALAPVIDWAAEAQSANVRIRQTLLAVRGAVPARKMGPPPPMPGALSIGAEEESAVVAVIRSQRLGRFGSPRDVPSRVEEFERRFAVHMGTERALAVSSGTAALHAALVGLEIGIGDEVIVPAYTWLGTATAVCNAGAIPIIADIDSSLTLDPESVESCISPHTRAIVAVHMRGAPARMAELCAIAKRHRLFVIEDVAQAMGGSYRGRRLGTIGDAGCFSMQTFKILDVGEGGVVIARDPVAFERVAAFHGLPSSAQTLLSLNFKMNEMAGAVGCAQLDRLDGMLAQMRETKRAVWEVLRDVEAVSPLSLRAEVDRAGDTCVSATFFAETAGKAEAIHEALLSESIGSFRYYRPGTPDPHVFCHWDAIMQQKPLSPRGGPWRFSERAIVYAPDMCPQAIDLLSRGVEITILPQFSRGDVADILVGLRKVLARCA